MLQRVASAGRLPDWPRRSWGREHPAVTTARRNWADRTRPLWRIGNRIDAFQLRHFGVSVMSALNPGRVMVLETTGRTTGKRRFTPVGYWEEQGDYLIGGGAGGMSVVPDWVKNLRNDPIAAAWIDRSRIRVRAAELHGGQRDRAQQDATSIWPGVPKYEAKSGRVIPYFRLVPETTKDRPLPRT